MSKTITFLNQPKKIKSLEKLAIKIWGEIIDNEELNQKDTDKQLFIIGAISELLLRTILNYLKDKDDILNNARKMAETILILRQEALEYLNDPKENIH